MPSLSLNVGDRTTTHDVSLICEHNQWRAICLVSKRVCWRSPPRASRNQVLAESYMHMAEQLWPEIDVRGKGDKRGSTRRAETESEEGEGESGA
jgi:hypothetical protein